MRSGETRYSDILVEAQEVTLVCERQGGWNLQHIKTVDGNIIGDWRWYQASVKRWTELRERHGNVPVSPGGKRGTEERSD